MTQTFVEILLLVPTALCAGFVIFVAGVIQGVMNDLDEAAFKRFLTIRDFPVPHNHRTIF